MPHPNQLYAKRNLQRICIAAAVYWKEFQESLLIGHSPIFRNIGRNPTTVSRRR